jgi:hypothetical protein
MTYIPCPIPPGPSRISKVVVLAGLAALASLGACTCGVGAPPEVSTAADAHVTDAAYCAELGRLALRYTGHTGGNGGLAPDYTTLDAIADCNKGNTAAGIQILEKKLHCAGFTLPKR